MSNSTVLFGIGCDLCHIPRFVRLLSIPFYFQSLPRKILHPREIQQFHQLESIHQPQFIASRWAVKEAVTKAIGARVLFPEILIQTSKNTKRGKKKEKKKEKRRKIITRKKKMDRER